MNCKKKTVLHWQSHTIYFKSILPLKRKVLPGLIANLFSILSSALICFVFQNWACNLKYKTIFYLWGYLFNLKITWTYKNSSFHISFTRLPLMLTSSIPWYSYQDQEININKMLFGNLYTLFKFLQFSPLISFFYFRIQSKFPHCT
jgi:hypothetical protein